MSKHIEDKCVAFRIPLQSPVRHGQVQHQEDQFCLEPKLEHKVFVKMREGFGYQVCF
jgi:hypothetical protein